MKSMIDVFIYEGRKIPVLWTKYKSDNKNIQSLIFIFQKVKGVFVRNNPKRNFGRFSKYSCVRK